MEKGSAGTSARKDEVLPVVTVHGDCPNFRGADDVALKNTLCRRENGTVPLDRKGTGTFFGLGVSTERDDQTGRKMSQSPAACERLQTGEAKMKQLVP